MVQIKRVVAHSRAPSEQRARFIKPQKLAYSIAEFAQMTGVGRSLLYEEITKGNLRVRKAGRRTLILQEDGQAWLSKLPVAARERSSTSTS